MQNTLFFYKKGKNKVKLKLKRQTHMYLCNRKQYTADKFQTSLAIQNCKNITFLDNFYSKLFVTLKLVNCLQTVVHNYLISCILSYFYFIFFQIKKYHSSTA